MGKQQPRQLVAVDATLQFAANRRPRQCRHQGDDRDDERWRGLGPLEAPSASPLLSRDSGREGNQPETTRYRVRHRGVLRRIEGPAIRSTRRLNGGRGSAPPDPPASEGRVECLGSRGEGPRRPWSSR